MKPGSSSLTALLCIFAIYGCSATPRRVVLPPTASVPIGDAGTLVAAYPLGAEENIRSVLLMKTADMSMHLVQIRRGETPHVHAAHDLVVTMMQGEGVLHVGERTQPMRSGDVAVIPRNTRHFFVNHGRTPAVAFVSFAPPYDGKDQVPVE